ncbi:MAG: hypothetical protein H0U27_05105 [Nitrosopumilus sp.]|nr:hypothetical protein [Nitrosopumilus sp.]
MDHVATHRQNIEIPLILFSILSKSDNLLMFCVAKEGLETNSNILHNDIPTKKRYYKALKQLKEAGLIAKSSNHRSKYFHTIYGSIVYQREVVEMEKYKKHIEKIRFIDNLEKEKKYSDKDILKLIQYAINNDKVENNNGVSSPPLSSPLASEIIASYDELMPSISKKVRECSKELLIATRFYSEELLNEISLRAKVGIKVKVLADTKMVRYFKSQVKDIESTNDIDDQGKNMTDNNNENERISVIGDLWYPNNEGIDRKVCDIPFYIIVMDGKEAGVELIDCNNTQNFFAGIIIKDENFAAHVKELYLKVWNSARSQVDSRDSIFHDKENVW